MNNGIVRVDFVIFILNSEFRCCVNKLVSKNSILIKENYNDKLIILMAILLISFLQQEINNGTLIFYNIVIKTLLYRMSSNISHAELLRFLTIWKCWRKVHKILIAKTDIGAFHESTKIYETLRFCISIETYRPTFHVNAFVVSSG